jgi:hypothetical protein
VLLDAFSRAARAADTCGGRLVVVDALDAAAAAFYRHHAAAAAFYRHHAAAAAFYRHHDFTPVKDNPHRLVLKIASIRELLD